MRDNNGRGAPGPEITRRELIRGAVAGTLAIAGAPALAKPDDPRKIPPQPGDELMFPSWEQTDMRVQVADVPLGGPPLLVYPRDPVSGVVREKSRLNQILLLRFDAAELSEETREFAADGVVAYSGVCTHTGCSVSEWDAEARNLLCPCHASQFDPRERAAIIGGPASRPLPALPIAVAADGIVVAGPFSAKVGGKKS